MLIHNHVDDRQPCRGPGDGSDFSGSDLRAAIFSRAIMPGVNLEGADMQNAFLDYVVLRGSNMRGVIAAGANFIRSDLGEVDVTDADFSEAVIDRYQAGPHTRSLLSLT
jgi:uncharacterized protein YjbI with pentapeptide repeats